MFLGTTAMIASFMSSPMELFPRRQLKRPPPPKQTSPTFSSQKIPAITVHFEIKAHHARSMDIPATECVSIFWKTKVRRLWSLRQSNEQRKLQIVNYVFYRYSPKSTHNKGPCWFFKFKRCLSSHDLSSPLWKVKSRGRCWKRSKSFAARWLDCCKLEILVLKKVYFYQTFKFVVQLMTNHPNIYILPETIKVC